MMLECYAELGQTAKANEYNNLLRNVLDGWEPANLSLQDLRDSYRAFWARAMNREGLRFSCLKRWGVLLQEIPNAKEMLPIPASALNQNPNLQQNMGWDSGTPSYSLSVSPTSLNFIATGEQKTFTVTSNTSWTVSSNASWCTVSPASGSNNGTVSVTAVANLTASPRTATVSVSGDRVATQTISVTQAAAGSDDDVLYSHCFRSDTIGWTLKNVTVVNSYEGSLRFATVGSLAIAPVLERGATGMNVNIRARYGNYIELHTSSDGNMYTNLGAFSGNSGLANATKSVPDGTRYLKFVAMQGTANDVYLVAVSVNKGKEIVPCSGVIINWGTGSIEGKVDLTVEANPVLGAVKLPGFGFWSSMSVKSALPDDYILVAVTTFDDNGNYIFEDLPEGIYMLVMIVDGEFIPLSGIIALHEDEKVQGLNFALDEDEDGAIILVINPAITGVRIKSDVATVKQGKTLKFDVAVDTHGGASPNVTWSVTGNKSATTTISGGLLAVAQNESAATLTITATSAFDPTKASATVAVETVTAVETWHAASLQIYPNPFSGEVRIIGAVGAGLAPAQQQTGRGQPVPLQVINTAGNIVHTQIITSPDETINLAHLPAGVYFFRFENDGMTKTVKVMKL